MTADAAAPVVQYRIPSSSSLPLVHACLGAWALPHGGRNENPDARMGDALHEHMDHRAKLGIGEAMRQLEAVADRHQLNARQRSIFLARARHFEWCPPPGAYGEVALCLLEGGDVVRMVGGKGQYRWPAGAITGGTLDLTWCEIDGEPVPFDLTDPEHPRCPPRAVLWAPDMKTGDEDNVDPVEHNWQILTNALLAMRWTGARAVVPGVIYWRKGPGEWEVPPRAWGEREARAHEHALVARLLDLREEQTRAARGEPLTLTTGQQCTYCPARSRCPEHTALVHLAATGRVVPQSAAPLTPEARVWLAQHLAPMERAIRDMRATLIADVQANGPIDLGGGEVWGPTPNKRTQIVVDQALPVLAEVLGEDRAAATVERKITRDAIEEAAAEALAATGKRRGRAAIVKQAYAKMGEAGALVTEEGVQYRAHKAQGVDLVAQDDEIEDLDPAAER